MNLNTSFPVDLTYSLKNPTRLEGYLVKALRAYEPRILPRVNSTWGNFITKIETVLQKPLQSKFYNTPSS